MDKSYKVFVGGLPVRVDRDAIAEFFAAFGTVLNCKLKKNQQTGRSLGFAYLTVKEKEAYDRLLSEPVVFQGRVIDVKPMWKKKELGDRLEEEKKKKIFVSNLPQDLTNPELMAYFSKFGQIANAFIIKDPDTEGYKDYGYVVYRETAAIDRVFKQADTLLVQGNKLQVERCTNSVQIAVAKQTSSLRGSKQSSALAKDSLDPLKSPLLTEEVSPLFEQGRSNISAFWSGKSTGSQGKLDKCSQFSLFGPASQPKIVGTISKFGEAPAREKAIGVLNESPHPIPGCQAMLEPGKSPQKSSFIIKASPTEVKRQSHQEASFPDISKKVLLLEISARLNERESNYAFNFKPSSRHRRPFIQW